LEQFYRDALRIHLIIAIDDGSSEANQPLIFEQRLAATRVPS
jgi:hypothetical protein